MNKDTAHPEASPFATNNEITHTNKNNEITMKTMRLPNTNNNVMGLVLHGPGAASLKERKSCPGCMVQCLI